jgi:hypothetical protein
MVVDTDVLCLHNGVIVYSVPLQIFDTRLCSSYELCVPLGGRGVEVGQPCFTGSRMWKILVTAITTAKNCVGGASVLTEISNENSQDRGMNMQ